ncbi:hypothetical protein B0H65DRAFT_79585 [Neurospora tetraspora]|uniref:Secreted protein n=1 Tax=Neurospora tetraspora TaxID=94610 RepID=A0AAE0J0J2_9PEZI|nr:hypothetical protein B0H65DRAFT_79585 [Neurospora tetraspora]
MIHKAAFPFRQTVLLSVCLIHFTDCAPCPLIVASLPCLSRAHRFCYTSFEAQQPSNAAIIRRYPHAKHGHRYRPQAPETMVKRLADKCIRNTLGGLTAMYHPSGRACMYHHSLREI